MTYRLIAVAVLAIPGFAQEIAKPPEPKTDAAVVRRLESITWNPVAGELSWVVSNWKPEESLDQPQSKDTYTMRIDAAVMQFEGERRRFDADEAKNVRTMMDLISIYAIESTVWWDQGLGDKLKQEAEPDAGPGTGTRNRDQNEKPKAEPKSAPIKLKGPFAYAAPGPSTRSRLSN